MLRKVLSRGSRMDKMTWGNPFQSFNSVTNLQITKVTERQDRTCHDKTDHSLHGSEIWLQPFPNPHPVLRMLPHHLLYPSLSGFLSDLILALLLLATGPLHMLLSLPGTLSLLLLSPHQITAPLLLPQEAGTQLLA